MVIIVNAYFDLSILSHVVISLISLFLPLVIFSKKSNYSYTTNKNFLDLIAYLLNLYFIPYFLLFYFLIRILLICLLKKDYFKVELIYLVYYWLNIAFLLLVGGTFIYEGILYINQPISCLFILILPTISIIVMLLDKQFHKHLKQDKYVKKVTLIIANKKLIVNGYLDSGNIAKHNDLPVIFVNFEIVSNLEYESIYIQGLDKNKLLYQGIKASIIIFKKKFDCYIIANTNLKLFNNCNCLLNFELFN